MKKKKVSLLLCLLMVSICESQVLYVKLKKPIQESRELFSKTQQRFSIRYKKNEATSKLLGAHIYKIDHSLDKQIINELVQLLENNSDVIYTSLMHESPSPPNDIPPTTIDFISNQGYLESNPGVNARYAWSQGANGVNIALHVLEYGMNIDHEEFVGRAAKIADNMTISSDLPFRFKTHGTATAGVIYGDNGNYGVKGIAYNASQYVLYPEWQEGKDWDRIEAVTNAVNAAQKGDIIVYQMQIRARSQTNYVMAEYDPLVWDLTLEATKKGLVVVAAAGNGGVNTNNSEYDDYHARGDSGAIIVGAGLPDLSHATGVFSTYGSRVNVHAWGRSVYTSGYGHIQFGNDINQYYTGFYSGTSSATAIVGGCAAALQSYYYGLTNEYLSSIEMRDLLRSTGIPQHNGTFKHVGPIPNLRNAIDKIDRDLNEKNNLNKSLTHLSLYPNPASDFLTIKQINIEPKEVLIFDYLGKLLMRTQIDKKINTIDFSNFSKGIYLVKIVFENQVLVKKVIKN